MKSLISIFMLVFCLASTAIGQGNTLRKLILKSDVIISDISNFEITNRNINDFTSETTIEITNTNLPLRNTVGKLPQKIITKVPKDNEDYFSDAALLDARCVLKAKDLNETYFDVIFLKKVGKSFQSLAIMYEVEYKNYKDLQDQITNIKLIENSKSEAERFAKTLDWFILTGQLPDQDFLEYYKSKGFNTDSIEYSKAQIDNAYAQFQKGKTALLPIIYTTYFDQIKAVYIEKLKTIQRKSTYDFGDCYDFKYTIRDLTKGFNDDYDDYNYLLTNLIMQENIDDYQKSKIMSVLIDTAEEWSLETK